MTESTNLIASRLVDFVFSFFQVDLSSVLLSNDNYSHAWIPSFSSIQGLHYSNFSTFTLLYSIPPNSLQTHWMYPVPTLKESSSDFTFPSSSGIFSFFGEARVVCSCCHYFLSFLSLFLLKCIFFETISNLSERFKYRTSKIFFLNYLREHCWAEVHESWTL